MKGNFPVNAGIVSAIAAVVFILIVYMLLGTVDLVFMNDGRQIERMEDVNMLTEITLPEGNLTYEVDGETKELGSVDDLKSHISTTLLTNLFTFKWQESDHVITITVDGAQE